MDSADKHKLFSRHQIISSIDDFMTLESKWQELLACLPGYLPSMTFEWNSAWIAANKERIDYLYIIVFYNANGSITGIVPMYVYSDRYLGIRVRILDMIGGRDHYTANILTLQEHLVELLNQSVKILKAGEQQWHFITLRRISQSQALSIQLERVLSSQHMRFATESMIKVPVIYIDGDFDRYFSGLKKQFRREIRRKRRLIADDGSGAEIEFKVYRINGDLRSFEEFLDLEDSGWKGDRQSSLKNRDYLRQTFRNLIKNQTNRLDLLIFQMRRNGKILSSSICLQTVNGMYVLRIAYDEEFARYSPGLLLRLYEIEYCFKAELKVYNFAGAEQPWMRHFTDRGLHSMDFIIYNDNLVAGLLYQIDTRLKPLIKKQRRLFELGKRLLHR